MKLNILKLSSIILFLAFVCTACNKNDEDIHGEIAIKDFNYVGCKNESEKSAPIETLKCKAEGNYLFVKHENALFNCCIDALVVEVSQDSSSVILAEKETGAYCDCICRYDLECKVGPLEYGEYVFVLKRDSMTHTEFKLYFSSTTDSLFIIK